MASRSAVELGVAEDVVTVDVDKVVVVFCFFEKLVSYMMKSAIDGEEVWVVSMK